MKRPEVNLENHAAVYEYYKTRNPHKPTAYFLHRLFGAIFHPQVSYAPGAEDAIGGHFGEDGRVILAIEHRSGADPLVIAAAAQQERVLRPLRGNVIIPGLAPLFKHRALRPVIDNFVALPTLRGKDVRRASVPEAIATQIESGRLPESAGDEWRLAAQAGATQGMIDVCITKADEGKNIAIFPQGTRQGGRVRSGLGRIACGIADRDRFRIVTIGIDYSDTFTNLRPNVVVGMPLGIPETPDMVTEMVERAFQVNA